MWTHANRVKRTGRVARTRRRSSLRPSRPLLEQATYRRAAVAACPRQFVNQLTVRPRWLAAAVPFAQHCERLVVVQCESSGDTTTDAERLHVAMLSGDCRWNCSDVLT